MTKRHSTKPPLLWRLLSTARAALVLAHLANGTLTIAGTYPHEPAGIIVIIIAGAQAAAFTNPTLKPPPNDTPRRRTTS